MFAPRNKLLAVAAALTLGAICFTRPAAASIPSAIEHPQLIQTAAAAPALLSAPSAPSYVLLSVAPDGSWQVEFCRNDPVNVTDPTGLGVLSMILGLGYSGAPADAFDAELHDQYWSGKMSGDAVAVAAGEFKIVAGWIEGKAGVAVAAGSGGILGKVGLGLVADASSRITGGSGDILNVFDEGSRRWDPVGNFASLGGRKGELARDVLGAVTLAGALNRLAAAGAVAANAEAQAALRQAESSPAPAAKRTNAELIQGVATRAEDAVGGTGRFAGTEKHAYAKRLLDKYQGIYDNRGLKTETTWLNGVPERYGTKGAARIDVLDVNASWAYDYKFKVNPPGLSPAQTQKIMTHGPAGLQGVLEVNP